jgi:hypothetical protein
MQTSTNDQAHRHLARAWALLDRAEQLARQAARDEAGPSLWLLAANSILRARDSIEAIDPAAPHTAGPDALFDGDCQALVWAAVCEVACIPASQEPVGLSVALVHLAAAEHEVGGRFCR